MSGKQFSLLRSFRNVSVLPRNRADGVWVTIEESVQLAYMIKV